MPNKRSSLTFGILLSCLLLLTLLPVAQANTFEDRIAHRFIRNYAQNEHRLQAIRRELDALPQPYQREPTGTGGFMSHPRKRSSNKISLSFEWKQHTQIDSVALFPLRLFMDEIYDENLYWPAQFSIEVIGKGQTNIVASGSLTAPQLPLSLPELIEFDPVSARKLTIRLTGLPQHPVQKWYAAGLAEILIFSGNENVAPRATCTTSSSRQGFYVLANNFVTDGQTPLGLPEINDPSKTHSFRKIIVPQKIPKTPYRLTLSYADPVDLDCVRIDPAIEHSYGQSFPLRFQIDLLDETGTVLQSDQTYADFPLRNPGLNPHYSYFPTTKTTSICLTVLEASQPTPAARPAISFSEITAVLQGNHLKAPDIIEEKFQGKVIRLDRSLVLQNKGSTLKYLCD